MMIGICFDRVGCDQRRNAADGPENPAILTATEVPRKVRRGSQGGIANGSRECAPDDKLRVFRRPR
jgi:hypothetical protein